MKYVMLYCLAQHKSFIGRLLPLQGIYPRTGLIISKIKQPLPTEGLQPLCHFTLYMLHVCTALVNFHLKIYIHTYNVLAVP